MRRTWTVDDALTEKERQSAKGSALDATTKKLTVTIDKLKARLEVLIVKRDDARRAASNAHNLAGNATNRCQDCDHYLYGRNGDKLLGDVYLVLDPDTGDTATPRAYRCPVCQEKAIADPKRERTARNPEWAKPEVRLT